MPRKGNSGPPPLTPINGGRKSNVSHETRPSRPPDMELPPEFTQRRNGTPKPVTSRVVKNGSLQNRAKAFYAIPILTKLFNSLLRSLDADDPSAQDKAAKIMGLLSDGKGGPNININQTNANDNRTATIRTAREFASPDEMYRQIEEERQKRLAMPRSSMPLQLESTPIELNPEDSE